MSHDREEPTTRAQPPALPLIAHVVHRLDFGGLENGMVNLIRQLPADQFRHAVISLTDYSSFRQRLPASVPVYALHKRPGQDFGLYRRLWRCFRGLRPTIVHTRNLATLEAQLAAWFAGVPLRVHGEHGRDVHDLDNTRSRYLWMRRLLSPWVHRYTAVSQELYDYATGPVGISPTRIERICNGVDTERFKPRATAEMSLPEAAQHLRGRILIGTVGRMQAVKDPGNLVAALGRLVAERPELRSRLGIIMVGDGPLKAAAEQGLAEAGLGEVCWLPGSRQDTPEILACLDIFVLPSLAEGISNTVLEAMATGLPVIATAVGGNSELVVPGTTGQLVPRADPDLLASAIARYLDHPQESREHGVAGRARALAEFSLAGMVARYQALYAKLIHRTLGSETRSVAKA